MTEQQWTTPSFSLRYRWIPGGKDTLVFFPGTFLDHRMYGPQVEAFQDRYSLMLLELPTCAEACMESASLFEDFSLALFGLLSKEDRGLLHLVGHSLGGALAQHYALRFPETVGSLTLMESSPLWKAPCFSTELRMQRASAPLVRFQPLPLFKGSLLQSYPPRAKSFAADQIETVPRKDLLGLLSSFQREREKVTAPASFSCPVLVVYGDGETLRGQLCGEAWQDHAEHLLDVISDASTHPSMEQPREFNEKLEGFLRRIQGTPSTLEKTTLSMMPPSEETFDVLRDFKKDLQECDRRTLQDALRIAVDADPLLLARVRLPKDSEEPLLPPTMGGLRKDLFPLLPPSTFHALHGKHLQALKEAMTPFLREQDVVTQLRGELQFHEEVLVALYALKKEPLEAAKKVALEKDLLKLLYAVAEDLLNLHSALLHLPLEETLSLTRSILRAARNAFALQENAHGRSMFYALLPHLQESEARSLFHYLTLVREHLEKENASDTEMEAHLDLEALVMEKLPDGESAEDYLRYFLHYRFLRNRFIEKALAEGDFQTAWTLSKEVLKEGLDEDQKTQDRYLRYGESAARGLGDRSKEMDILQKRILFQSDMDAYLALQQKSTTEEWAAQRALLLTEAVPRESQELLKRLQHTEAALYQSLEALSKDPEAFFREQPRFLSLLPRETRLVHRQILLALADESVDRVTLQGLDTQLTEYAAAYGAPYGQRLADTLIAKHGHRKEWQGFSWSFLDQGSDAKPPSLSAFDKDAQRPAPKEPSDSPTDSV